MPSVVQVAGQCVFYAAAAVLTGYLSQAPAHRQTPPGLAQVKLSFAYGARRVEACRKLTAKEIAALPPSQRRPNTCGREREPVYVEFELDGRMIYARSLQPTGLSRDGPARTYQKFLVATGEHTLVARLRDGNDAGGFDYEMAKSVKLEAGQSVAVDFRAEEGGFILR